jgi:DNA-binding MarR family transcriptional regulator
MHHGDHVAGRMESSVPYKTIFPAPTGEFDVDAPDDIFYLLFQVLRRRDAAYDADVAPPGMTAARSRTLSIIRRVEDCTMSTLANFSTIDRTTLTREVDHLVAAGFVARSVPANDRRRINLQLTDKGEALYKQFSPALGAFDRRVLADVSPDRQSEIARGLQIMLRNLTAGPALTDNVIAFGSSSEVSRALADDPSLDQA